MIKELDWDSNFFGYKIGSCQGKMLAGEALGDFEKEFNDKKFDCVYIFCDAEDPVCERLENRGHKNLLSVDGHVKYELSKEGWEEKEGLSKSPGECIIAQDKEKKDSDFVKEVELLSEEIALVSRFYIDSKFRSHAKAMYKIWVDNIINSESGLTVINIIDKQVTGVVACRVKDGVGIVELVKAKSGFEGLGIASKMTNYAIKTFFEQGIEKVSVVTQINNEPARRLYERCGFSVAELTNIYHWWK